jgi:hypothetical protein
MKIGDLVLIVASDKEHNSLVVNALTQNKTAIVLQFLNDKDVVVRVLTSTRLGQTEARRLGFGNNCIVLDRSNLKEII